MSSHHQGPMMHQFILCRTSNFYFTSYLFNACMLATSARSLNSLYLDPNNVILANSFYEQISSCGARVIWIVDPVSPHCKSCSVWFCFALLIIAYNLAMCDNLLSVLGDLMFVKPLFLIFLGLTFQVHCRVLVVWWVVNTPSTFLFHHPGWPLQSQTCFLSLVFDFSLIFLPTHAAQSLGWESFWAFLHGCYPLDSHLLLGWDRFLLDEFWQWLWVQLWWLDICWVWWWCNNR